MLNNLSFCCQSGSLISCKLYLPLSKDLQDSLSEHTFIILRIFSADSDGRLVVHDVWNRTEVDAKAKEAKQISPLKARQQLFSTSPVHSFKRLKFQ